MEILYFTSEKLEGRGYDVLLHNSCGMQVRKGSEKRMCLKCFKSKRKRTILVKMRVRELEVKVSQARQHESKVEIERDLFSVIEFNVICSGKENIKLIKQRSNRTL